MFDVGLWITPTLRSRRIGISVSVGQTTNLSIRDVGPITGEIPALTGEGDVVVSGQRDGRNLQIAVSNPVAPGKSRSKDGNKMAMANIRQRFELAYGSRASVNVDDADDRYTVTLRFPIDEDDA